MSRTKFGITEAELCDLDAAHEEVFEEWSRWRAATGRDQPQLALG